MLNVSINLKYLYKPSKKYNTMTLENKIDLLVGGSPCQSFSIIGKKEGFANETCGTLFFDIADILKRTNPKSFMLENVEGLLKHEKGNEKDLADLPDIVKKKLKISLLKILLKHKLLKMLL